MHKADLTPVEQIEYYLGKDSLPNLHWKPEIPPAWKILPRANMMLCNDNIANTTVTLENICYSFNNLGYRSNFDYVLENLKNKQIVLLLGDSDTFARGVEHDSMYTTRVQYKSDLLILNLGVPGISADGMTRIGVQTLLALGSAVKHVCVLWPVSSLREFVSKTFCSGVHTHSQYTPYKNWWKHIDWVSNNYNYQKNRLLIKNMCCSAGAQYHDLMINRYDQKSNVSYNKIENGAWTEFDSQTHEAIANYFLRKITNQPSLFQELQS